MGLMGDRIDTEEKNAELFMPGGQDEIAGHHINGKFRKLCGLKKFRDTFNIKYRKDGKYDLLDKETVVDFTGAGANTRTEHIHSSQRWFYKETNGTCAISEYFRHLYSQTNNQDKKALKKDLKNFVDFKKIPPKKTKLTFQQIPLGEVKTIIDKRLELVADPERREEKLREYYAEN